LYDYTISIPPPQGHMPKKNRNGQRKQEHESNSPSPALIDMGGYTPETETRQLGESSPLFTFDADVDRGGGGTSRFYGVGEEGDDGYGVEEAVGAPVDRPSPLSLSPLPPPTLASGGGANYTDESALGHTRSPVLSV
jgi:hypothetical protein